MKCAIKIYKCDPDKFVTCKKGICYRNGGVCNSTTHKRFRMNIFKRFKEWLGVGNENN